MRDTGPNNAGFTLMEIMVSVLVLAVALTVIMQLMAGGLRSEKLSEDYLAAVVCGRSTMEALMLEKALAAGSMRGVCAGGYRWQAVIAQDPALAKEPTRSGLLPFQIDLEVLWQSGTSNRSFHLTSLQLAQVKQEDSRAQ